MRRNQYPYPPYPPVTYEEPSLLGQRLKRFGGLLLVLFGFASAVAVYVVITRLDKQVLAMAVGGLFVFVVVLVLLALVSLVSLLIFRVTRPRYRDNVGYYGQQPQAPVVVVTGEGLQALQGYMPGPESFFAPQPKQWTINTLGGDDDAD